MSAEKEITDQKALKALVAELTADLRRSAESGDGALKLTVTPYLNYKPAEALAQWESYSHAQVTGLNSRAIECDIASKNPLEDTSYFRLFSRHSHYQTADGRHHYRLRGQHLPGGAEHRSAERNANIDLTALPFDKFTPQMHPLRLFDDDPARGTEYGLGLVQLANGKNVLAIRRRDGRAGETRKMLDKAGLIKLAPEADPAAELDHYFSSSSRDPYRSSLCLIYPISSALVLALSRGHAVGRRTEKMTLRDMISKYQDNYTLCAPWVEPKQIAEEAARDRSMEAAPVSEPVVPEEISLLRRATQCSALLTAQRNREGAVEYFIEVPRAARSEGLTLVRQLNKTTHVAIDEEPRENGSVRFLVKDASQDALAALGDALQQSPVPAIKPFHLAMRGLRPIHGVGHAVYFEKSRGFGGLQPDERETYEGVTFVGKISKKTLQKPRHFHLYRQREADGTCFLIATADADRIAPSHSARIFRRLGIEPEEPLLAVPLVRADEQSSRSSNAYYVRTRIAPELYDDLALGAVRPVTLPPGDPFEQLSTRPENLDRDGLSQYMRDGAYARIDRRQKSNASSNAALSPEEISTRRVRAETALLRKLTTCKLASSGFYLAETGAENRKTAAAYIVFKNAKNQAQFNKTMKEYNRNEGSAASMTVRTAKMLIPESQGRFPVTSVELPSSMYRTFIADDRRLRDGENYTSAFMADYVADIPSREADDPPVALTTATVTKQLQKAVKKLVVDDQREKRLEASPHLPLVETLREIATLPDSKLAFVTLPSQREIETDLQRLYAYRDSFKEWTKQASTPPISHKLIAHHVATPAYAYPSAMRDTPRRIQAIAREAGEIAAEIQRDIHFHEQMRVLANLYGSAVAPATLPVIVFRAPKTRLSEGYRQALSHAVDDPASTLEGLQDVASGAIDGTKKGAVALSRAQSRAILRYSVFPLESGKGGRKNNRHAGILTMSPALWPLLQESLNGKPLARLGEEPLADGALIHAATAAYYHDDHGREIPFDAKRAQREQLQKLLGDLGVRALVALERTNETAEGFKVQASHRGAQPVLYIAVDRGNLAQAVDMVRQLARAEAIEGVKSYHALEEHDGREGFEAPLVALVESYNHLRAEEKAQQALLRQDRSLPVDALDKILERQDVVAERYIREYPHHLEKFPTIEHLLAVPMTVQKAVATYSAPTLHVHNGFGRSALRPESERSALVDEVAALLEESGPSGLILRVPLKPETAHGLHDSTGEELRQFQAEYSGRFVGYAPHTTDAPARSKAGRQHRDAARTLDHLANPTERKARTSAEILKLFADYHGVALPQTERSVA